MTDKTEAQRLAAWLKASVCIYPQTSEDEPGGYATEFDQVADEAAAELLRLDAENAALRDALNGSHHAIRHALQYAPEGSQCERILRAALSGTTGGTK